MCLPATIGVGTSMKVWRTTATDPFPVVCKISRKVTARARAGRPHRRQYHECRQRYSCLFGYELLLNHQYECVGKAARHETRLPYLHANNIRADWRK